MEPEEFQKAWAKVVAKAWSDAAFKERLLQDPNTVLKENGIVVPEGVDFKVMENSDKTFHLTLPRRPSELGVEELEQVAGGAAKVLSWIPGRCTYTSYAY